MIWQDEVGKILYYNNMERREFLFIFLKEMNELVDEMVEAVDDGDGEIDYDEFLKMIQKY